MIQIHCKSCNITVFGVVFQPLMVRFQAAYKSHLIRQQEKVNLELRELVSTSRNIWNVN